MLKRSATALGLFVLCVLSILRVGRAAAPVPATSPDTVFSAERALRHVEQIAQRPHGMGTADHDRVRDYVAGQLTAMGLRPQVQQATAVGTRTREAGHVQNVLAWLPGSDPKGKVLLLVAHYDGVNAGPAASDDGAGCAALLETLRALVARKQPLKHDVVALFTDGEEAGLLGAAAFVREHPWAKDVAMIVNVEARGTTGRSYMFETGPGNLDAARVLRRVGGVSASSIYTTIYRLLPNDTDLSELAVLGTPALNFAFADGVERYHTSRDDLAHLNPGSLQEHGHHMLGVTTIVGNEALPRPVSGDGVFFDLPVVGLVAYPVWLSIPLALLAVVLVGVVIARDRAGVAVGFGAAVVAVLVSALVGYVAGRLPRGHWVWSGLYASAVTCFVIAATVAVRALALRWSTPRGLLAGGMIVWALLGAITSVAAPATSFLFVWPVLFAAAAALLGRGREVAEWVSAAMTLFVTAGFAYGASVVMLGLAGMGAIALALLVSLAVLLLAPQVETLTAGVRWGGAQWAAAAGAALLLIGLVAIRRSPDHPQRSALVYAQNADSADAWLLTSGGAESDWARSAVGAATAAPAWTRQLSERGGGYVGRAVPRAALAAPNAAFVRDTVINNARRVVMRITAPAGTTALYMRARGAPILTASIDGRVVDTTRYRRRLPDWTMTYSAVPDSGAVVALSIPLGVHIEVELAARRPGLPASLTIPPRPDFVAPSQEGDVSVVYRLFRF